MQSSLPSINAGAGRPIDPLTAIRGVVALWVVGHHCSQRVGEAFLPPAGVREALHVGYVGVDIFFVLSGFVLAYVHLEMAPGGVPDFFRRRVARIYPLNLIATSILALTALAGLDCGAPVGWPELPSALLMLQPFTTDAPKWLLVNWSIGIEIACYAVFPLLIFTLRYLHTGVIAAVFCGILWVEYQADRDYSVFWWGYPALMRCAPAFCLGVSAFILIHRAESAFRKIPALLITLAEYALLGGILQQVLQQQTIFVPDLAALLITLLYLDRGWLAKILHAHALVWLGDISYSIYLLHLPIVTLLAHNLPALEKSLPAVMVFPAYFCIVIVPVMLIAHLSYRLIERPAKAWLTSSGRRRLPMVVTGE